MQQATRLSHPDRLFIGGVWREPLSGRRIDVLNAATEALFVRVADASEADIDLAVEAARSAFDQGPWPRLRHLERAQYMFRLADGIESRADDFARAWSIESGVAFRTSCIRAASTMAGFFRFYARMAETFPFEEEHPTRIGGKGLLVREPVGVVGAIVPWNAAGGLMTFKTAPALLAGCTIVVKASPEAPTAALLFAEVCEAVGLPPGVVNVVTAGREASERLVRHPGVDKITFTGSTAAGRRIAALCGERIARCTLELGGKSAALILGDADIECAVGQLTSQASYLTGQVCHALTRVIVGRERHDQFVEALAASFAGLKVGDPFAEDTDMGPLSTAHHRARVEAFIARGAADGAQLVSGGGRPAHLPRGFFLEPTIFARVDNASSLAREEVFGPVISIIAADNEAQAIDLANDSPYGLNASVFTPDPDRAYAVARQLRCGTVGHNGSGIDFTIAFGGFKQSGIGREGGREGLLPFLETKTIVFDPATFPSSLD